MGDATTRKRTTDSTFRSKVSPKGQITIPAEARTRFGIRPKDKVEITLEEDGVKVRPVASRPRDVYQSVPALDRAATDDELVDLAMEEHAAHVMTEGLPS